MTDLQKSIGLLPSKVFVDINHVKATGIPKVFERNAPLYHGKRGQVAKYHHCKEDTTNHVILRKGYGETEV